MILENLNLKLETFFISLYPYILNLSIMNRIKFGLTLLLTMLAFAVSAQSKVKHEDIFKDLAKTQPGYGTVKLQQNPKVNLLVNRKIKDNESKKYITFSGYRIQVYMDNNQKKSKDEAYAREKKLKEKYEDLTTYISFSSPFWKLRVGDYRTHADALVMAKKLREDFPELSSEILIVKDDDVRDVTLEVDPSAVKKDDAAKKEEPASNKSAAATKKK